MRTGYCLLAASLLLGACSTNSLRTSAADSAAIAAAIASSGRSAADRAEDSYRLPQAVLEAARLHPGMRVLDFLPGRGYYTDLIARTAGPRGASIAWFPPALSRFTDAIDARLQEGRLPGMQKSSVPLGELATQLGPLDAALLILVYHDLYLPPREGGMAPPSFGTPAEVVAALYAALRPGGLVLVEDHVAAAGAEPVSTAGSLHRIDPAVIRRDFEAGGFVLDGSSDALRNPSDDVGKPVFQAAVPHMTDRVLLRFRKP
ncbi:MAG: class I SAM-dependent methyltransferase [Gammaproteobacteria bacterium]|nr:class I SAM-dependent methyltransferase [Gammaproteobacteria bacterium]